MKLKINFRYFHDWIGKFFYFKTIDEAIEFADEEKLLEKFKTAKEIRHTLDVCIIATIIGNIDYEKLLEEVEYSRKFEKNINKK